MRRLIDVDPVSGIRTYFEVTGNDGKFQIHTVASTKDIRASVDYAKTLANDTEYKRLGIKNGWMHGAHIPPIVVHQWLKEGIDVMNPAHMDRVKRKLNDPDWKHLKTIHGRV